MLLLVVFVFNAVDLFSLVKPETIELPSCGLMSDRQQESASGKPADLSLNDDDFDEEPVSADDVIPWVVHIHKTKKKKRCTGTLINDRWVLTAGHCLKNVDVSEINVHAGSDKPLSGIKYPAEVTVVHPRFDENSYQPYDIGLVKTKDKIRITKKKGKYSVNGICLPQSKTIDLTKPFSIAGFGKKMIRNKLRHPDRLQVMRNVKLMASGSCRRETKKTIEKLGKTLSQSTLDKIKKLIPDSAICSMASINESPCKGDSGAPVFGQRPDGRYELVGIHYEGVGFHEGADDTQSSPCGFTELHLAVAGFYQWISDEINSH